MGSSKMAYKQKIAKEKISCDYVIFDLNSVLHRTFFANKDEDEDALVGLAVHVGLTTLNKYFKMVNPRRKVIVAFDRSSWRKEYTASEKCLSQIPYKGNRRKDMTPTQAAKFERYINHVKELEKLITNHSTIVTLAGDGLEADDLIAGFCQIYNEEEIVVVSTDSDLWQLMKYPNVRCLSPATGEFASLKDYGDDANYYLFQKCIRGDMQSDNIRSAYPRVQTKRILKAYTDEYERVALMKETWTDQNGKVVLVEDAFKENQLLIDLEKQPNEIRMHIYNTVEESMNTKKKFSHFHIMRYLGKYELEKIADNMDQYIRLLSL